MLIHGKPSATSVAGRSQGVRLLVNDLPTEALDYRRTARVATPQLRGGDVVVAGEIETASAEGLRRAAGIVNPGPGSRGVAAE